MKIFLKTCWMVFLFLLVLESVSFAELNLSVTPTTGTNTISFGRVDLRQQTNKEVRLRINSDSGKQFQVYQRLLEPLVNEKGQTLNLSSLKTYCMVGSNASGTVYLQSPQQMSSSEDLVYSSSVNGDSDSFNIIYVLDPREVNVSGTFMGKMIYTVRSVEGGERSEAYLNVDLDVSSQMEVIIEGVSSRDQVSLVYPDAVSVLNQVKVSFKDNLQGNVKVSQEIETWPQDSFEELGKDVLQFNTLGETKGTLSFRELNNVVRKQIQIYSSDVPEDTFNVSFNLNSSEAAKHKAGIYKGVVKYIVETSAGQSEYRINVIVEIKSIFTLDIEFPPEGMGFRDLLPESPPQFKEAIVKVKSNLGKPFAVIQKVNALLTNEKGEEINPKQFTLKLEMLGSTAGQTRYDDFTSVPKDESVLYTSDPLGHSAEFKVIYRLQSFAGVLPGSYSSSIVYSLEEK